MAAELGKTNLVEAPTPLIGRDTERAVLTDDLDRGTRLVTLVGPGGAGKTRLAVRFAIERAEAYAAHGGGGAWLCDLAGARNAMELCAVVAAALELPLDPATSEARVIADLGRRLAQRRRVLLVLDNCEHLVRDASAVITAWLGAAPLVHCVVTSRVALGVPGEQLRPIAGLGADEAVQLFVRRATEVRPDQPLGPDELAAIGDIVRRLDGLPLANELAAARTRLLSPAQLRDRLAPSLLARPGDPGRHGSMRGTILDSVASLDETARTSFACCAIFRGGFSLDAAEAVRASADTLAALEALGGHSLLRTIVAETGEARFALFEPIREVAAEQLAERVERAELADRHARYFAALGQRLAARAVSDPAALAELALELDNLVDAHAHASSMGASELALDLALALDPLLATRGRHRLRLRLLDAALAGASGGAVAAAHLARGHAHRELGDPTAARDDFTRGRGLAATPTLRALAELRLGELVEISGATAEAKAHYRRALDAVHGAREPAAVLRAADAHAHLGHALRREGTLEEAELHLASAVEGYRTTGHREGLGAMAYERAVLALFRAQPAVARGRFEDALALARSLGARQLEAAVNSGLGILLQELAEVDAAIAHHAAAIQVFRELGNRHREGSALYYLATAYLERGELVEAHAVLDQAANAIAAVGAHRYAALIDGARGAAHALAGEASEAARAFERADRAAAACATETSLAVTLAIHRLQLSAVDATARAAEARSLVATAPGDDTRLAERLLAAPSRERPRHGWLVRADGSAFRPPEATELVDLSRRAPLRRILAALARARVDAPGDSLGLDDLLGAGWPGERIAHAAAVNRVHVALATLRKLGLRGLLHSGERGYLLDPAAAVEVTA